MVRFEKLIKTTAFTRSWSILEIIYISPCCMHTIRKLFSYPSGSPVSLDSTLYKYQRKHLFQNVLARKQSADQCLYTYAHIWAVISWWGDRYRTSLLFHWPTAVTVRLRILTVHTAYKAYTVYFTHDWSRPKCVRMCTNTGQLIASVPKRFETSVYAGICRGWNPC